MDTKIRNRLISKYLTCLESSKNNIKRYKLTELNHLSFGTQLNHLMSITKLFESNDQRIIRNNLKYNKKILKHTDISLLTENDIMDLLEGNWYNSLKPQVQQLNILRIKAYLKFSKRLDLVELLPKRFKSERNQLSKNDLISREDLNIILKFCDSKKSALIMVMYEGALRRDELLNIRKKHIKFMSGYAILNIVKSKTLKRDIPLTESIPYLREYFDKYYIEPEDLIFPYKRPIYLNMYIKGLKNRIAKKYPEWKTRKFYPHLFRHSRLTELALSKLNEPQLNKIAGWTPNSNMGKVYFHLDDSDIINIMTDDVVQKPKLEKFELIICPICNVENKHQNYFCWKCNNVLDESKSAEAGLYLINQTGKVDTLTTEFSEIKEKILNMEKTIKLQEQYIFHLITKDTEYKDLKLDEDTNLTDKIIEEYNKILGK